MTLRELKLKIADLPDDTLIAVICEDSPYKFSTVSSVDSSLGISANSRRYVYPVVAESEKTFPLLVLRGFR